MTSGACSTAPPVMWASAWWPRQTPSTGSSERFSTSSETPTSRACSGRPGARGDHDVVHRQRRELVPRQLVVAHDHGLVAVDLAQQVEEVERERVVVVDQERPHGRIYTLPNVGTGERPFVAPARRRDGHPRGCRHARDHARQARADRGAGSCGRARHRAVRRHLGAAGRRGGSPSSRLRGTTAGSRATAIRTCSRCPTSRRPASSRGTTARRCCCATSSIATAAPSRCRRAPSCARWSIAPRPWASSRSSGSSSSSTRCARRRSRC